MKAAALLTRLKKLEKKIYRGVRLVTLPSGEVVRLGGAVEIFTALLQAEEEAFKSKRPLADVVDETFSHDQKLQIEALTVAGGSGAIEKSVIEMVGDTR